MKEKLVEVKTEGKVVDRISVVQFDTLDELLENVTPEQIVHYYNRQRIENERNVARAKHQPTKATKARRTEVGFKVAYDEFNEEFKAAIAGGSDKMMEFVNCEKVQKRVDEILTSSLDGEEHNENAEA